MENFHHLYTLAGLATSQFGFMAAFIGFTISAGRTFDHSERHFTRTLAIIAIVVLFACLVPSAMADAYPRVFLKVSMGFSSLLGWWPQPWLRSISLSRGREKRMIRLGGTQWDGCLGS